MAYDSFFCELIANIQKDPFRKVKDLTVGQYYALQEHVKNCEICIRITDEILEKYGDIPEDPNSDWNKTKYN